MPMCLVTEQKQGYVVLNGVRQGQPQNRRNYLLVPTERVMGIECPKLWTSLSKNNYWNDAWKEATRKGGKGEVYPGSRYQLALGVNSAVPGVRTQDQLHIHMATITTSTVHRDLDGQTNIATDPAKWKDSIFPVTGMAKGANTRNYRVLHLKNVHELESNNLFNLLYDNVVTKVTGENMSMQTMIVTKSGHGGFYVLSSCKSDSLHAKNNYGTDTCDYLLAYD
jgi:CDP-diacylglycerol pyrophosphatase